MVRALGQTAGGAYLAKQLLGPTLEMLGYRTRDMTEAMIANVAKVFDSAHSKANVAAEGSVPPRAVARVWEEAIWAEDDVVVEYLGGVLASSRTPTSRDDRGAIWAKKVGALSAYSIRLHYMLYESARRHLMGREIKLGQSRERRDEAGMYIPTSEILRCLDLGPREDLNVIVIHAIRSLQEEGLLDEIFSFSESDGVRAALKTDWAPPPGLVYWITHRGMELYLVAHGLNDRDPAYSFLDDSLELDLDVEVEVPVGAPLTDMRKVQVEDRDQFLLSRWA